MQQGDAVASAESTVNISLKEQIITWVTEPPVVVPHGT